MTNTEADKEETEQCSSGSGQALPSFCQDSSFGWEVEIHLPERREASEQKTLSFLPFFADILRHSGESYDEQTPLGSRGW